VGDLLVRLCRARELDPAYTGRSLWLLGDVALARGAYSEAERLLQRSAAAYLEYGLPNELIWVLADLAVAARNLGQPDLSKQHRDEALRTLKNPRRFVSRSRDGRDGPFPSRRGRN
jgi:tetratricopeptide (TPR) repeat protein